MSDTPNPEPSAATRPRCGPTAFRWPQQPPPKAAPPVAAQPYDFRGSSLLSPRQMRKLRAHESQFLTAMEARVALFLRVAFPVKLDSIQIVSYQRLAEAWTAPTHLLLFKTEPLRGVSILEIPIALGLTMVDRLMGGPGGPRRSGGK